TSPAWLNTSTDGAGTQHFERGGLNVAPFSSSVSERGRWNTQILSCASIAMPPTWPRIQLFGSGFGQYGSTRNAGLWALAVAIVAIRSARIAASLDATACVRSMYVL